MKYLILLLAITLSGCVCETKESNEFINQHLLVKVPKREKRFEEDPTPPQLTTIYFNCKNSKAKDVKNIVENFLSPDGLIAIDERLNLVIISDISSRTEYFVKQLYILERKATPYGI